MSGKILERTMLIRRASQAANACSVMLQRKVSRRWVSEPEQALTLLHTSRAKSADASRLRCKACVWPLARSTILRGCPQNRLGTHRLPIRSSWLPQSLPARLWLTVSPSKSGQHRRPWQSIITPACTGPSPM